MINKLKSKIEAHYKEAAKKEAERPKQKKLGWGNSDVMDVLSYAALKEEEDHIVIDGKFRRTLFISGLPRGAENGWLNSLLHFSTDMDLSIHIEQCDDMQAQKKLQKQITALESMRRSKERKNEAIYAKDLDPLESAEVLHANISRGMSRLFWVSIYVSFVADSLKELNEITELLEADLGKRAFMSRVARAQQIEAFQSVLPRAENVLAQRNDVDTVCTGIMMPFVSSELVHPNGILFGINKVNNSLVVIDRYALPNYNSIMFAQSGNGKSYTTKVEILRQLTQGTHVIVIDPEREYENLTQSVGGAYIRLSPRSKQKINPFDTATTATSKEDLSDHIQTLTELLTLMVGGISDIEEAVLDKAILKVYKSKKMPKLADLYKELKKSNEAEKLCVRLDKYLEGSLSGMFDHDTNIDLNNRLVVFDIKDVPSDKMRQLTMMVIANYVENVVKKRRKRRMLVIDEAWSLLQYEESARFLGGLTRRGRKYFLAVAMISQQADDFLKNKYGREIASQCALRILMKQDTTSIKRVVSEFNLSEREHKQLLTSKVGDALIIADRHHVSLHVTASKKEHPLITTDPREVQKA